MDIEQMLIALALFEDSGFGDVTTDNLLEGEESGTGIVTAKEPGVVSGLAVAARVFKTADPHAKFTPFCKDGERVGNGDVICEVRGNLAAMLKAERVALNFMQRLSGIATFTRSIVDCLAGTQVRLADTRKTAPGWRRLEKAAVRHGGGCNHRMALYDGVLIKDNHIAVAGNLTHAIERIRPQISHLMKIEVEVSALAQVKEAVKAGADVIMLDNMDIPAMKEAVHTIAGRAVVEASGSISGKNIREIAQTGVDVISSGAVTHQATAVDMSMRIIPG